MTIFIIPPKILMLFPLSFFFSFFKDFAIEKIKERNFLRVANLSFDARFARHSQFSLRHHKQCPINSIKVKMSTNWPKSL